MGLHNGNFILWFILQYWGMLGVLNEYSVMWRDRGLKSYSGRKGNLTSGPLP